jgi:hypothetical protein
MNEPVIFGTHGDKTLAQLRHVLLGMGARTASTMRLTRVPFRSQPRSAMVVLVTTAFGAILGRSWVRHVGEGHA